MEPLSRMTDATRDVLRALLDADGPVWGLAVIRAAQRPAGTVYPVLDRLERAGWLTSAWEQDDTRSGPRRRYYSLSADGAAAARQAVASAPRASAASAGSITRPRIVGA